MFGGWFPAARIEVQLPALLRWSISCLPASGHVGPGHTSRCFDGSMVRREQRAKRATKCRTPLLAVLCLHAGCCEWASGDQGCRSDVAGLRADLEAERAKTAQLEAQLMEARDRSALLQAQIDATTRPAAGADYAEPTRRVSNSSAPRTGLAPCPVTPIVNESLPRGSYMNSCRGCYRFGDSLRCSCFTRSQASHRYPQAAAVPCVPGLSHTYTSASLLSWGPD